MIFVKYYLTFIKDKIMLPKKKVYFKLFIEEKNISKHAYAHIF